MDRLEPLMLRCPAMIDGGVIKTASTFPKVEIRAFPGSGGTLIWNYLHGMGYENIGHGHGNFNAIAARKFLICRDPRDALCSTVKRLYWRELLDGIGTEEAFLLCIEQHPTYQSWIGSLSANFTRSDVVRIQFEDYCFGNEGALIDVLAHASALTVLPWYKAYLLWEFSLERNKLRMNQTSEGFGSIHPSTRIHGNHISSGKCGAWKETFTPRIIEAVKETMGDLIIKLGYERNMNW